MANAVYGKHLPARKLASRASETSATGSVTQKTNVLALEAPRAFICFRASQTSAGVNTSYGVNLQPSEWKYISLRRIPVFIEESFYPDTQRVVYEPNGEPLWAQIRLRVSTFFQTRSRSGALEGGTPGKANFVSCDGNTTPQNDMDRGIVNMHVEFVLVEPAEFVIITMKQIAG